MSLLRSSRWWVRIADFPRSQVALCLAGVLAALVLRGQTGWGWAVAAVVAAALGYQLFRVFPYTPLAPCQVPRARVPSDGPALRLLIANVLMENRDAGPLLGQIRRYQPDIVLLVETDAWWAERLLALEPGYPHLLRQPQDNYYGLHFYSRIPVTAMEIRRLVSQDVPSVRARLAPAGGRPFDFYGLHPRPPVPGQDSDERDAEILIVGREVRAAGIPAVVAGDLNDVAWSHTTRLFQRVSGLLDPRRGRGMFSSFHADYPMLRWPLDHVFHDAAFALIRLQRLPSVGSDHFPILVDLALQARPEAGAEVPEASPDDLEEAAELVEEGIEAAREPARGAV